MMDLENELKITIKGCRHNEQVRNALRKSGIEFDDRSWIDGNGREVLSLWVDNYRIYKPHRSREYSVQHWREEKFNYSGIPTFMPGGKDTFNKIL